MSLLPGFLARLAMESQNCPSKLHRSVIRYIVNRTILPQTPTHMFAMAPPTPGQQVFKIAGPSPIVRFANMPLMISKIPVYLNHLTRFPSMSSFPQDEKLMAYILHLCPRVAAKMSIRMPRKSAMQAAIVPMAFAKSLRWSRSIGILPLLPLLPRRPRLLPIAIIFQDQESDCEDSDLILILYRMILSDALVFKLWFELAVNDSTWYDQNQKWFNRRCLACFNKKEAIKFLTCTHSRSSIHK